MLKNYFRIAWRNLIREKQFSILNLLGLSSGLACAVLIFLWVKDEQEIDRFFENDDRLYQVNKTSVNADGTFDTHEGTPALLAASMAAEVPEVEYAASVVKGESGIITANYKNIKAVPQFADKDYLKIFSYTLLESNRESALKNKHEVILSKTLAIKLFENPKNAIGKTITWDGTDDELDGTYVVGSVFEMPPANATVQFDVLFSYALFYDTFREKYGMDKWYSNNPRTFLLLKPGTNSAQFNKKIRNFAREKFKAAHGTDGLEWEGIIFAQRYSDKYLHGNYENGQQAGGRITYVRLLSMIAIFIVVMACINFMNLATARASQRGREIGIKKVVGASRRSLVIQFFVESTIMALLSLVFALVMVYLALPQFRNLTGKALELSIDVQFLRSMLLIALGSGLLAGAYPAIYLSGFRPALVLKGKLPTSPRESFFRKSLVVFQFTISVVLIVAVIVVYRQMELVQNKNLGYNKDNVIRFESEGKLRKDLPVFLDELKKIPGVMSASGMTGDFVGNHGGGGGISWPGQAAGKGIEFDGLNVDDDVASTLGLRMAQGRFFARKFGAEKDKVIFNESAVEAMGLKDPVGKVVTMWGAEKEIIGVVKDFHFESLYKKVGPFFFRFQQDNQNVLVKLQAGKEKQSLAEIEKLFNDFNPGLTFAYKFLDEEYQRLYASEKRVSILSRYFAAVAVIISCLGLFGLTAYMAQKRRKEIGIRKVVGATVTDITTLLSKDFLRLVLLALLIALPFSWWAMNAWLADFAYRVTVDSTVFLLAGIAIVVVTLVTVSFQSIRSAMADPVRTLRSE